MRIGYAWTSIFEQDLNLQLDALVVEDAITSALLRIGDLKPYLSTEDVWLSILTNPS